MWLGGSSTCLRSSFAKPSLLKLLQEKIPIPLPGWVNVERCSAIRVDISIGESGHFSLVTVICRYVSTQV